MLLPIIIIGAVVLIGLFILGLYNSLVNLHVQIDEAWSQIDVQLKRRADLIPNIVESVKGYAKHEKEVFENVTKARSAMLKAETPDQKAKADNMISGALKSLFAVAESYPQLKANENFLQLQKELSDTEDKVSYSRQFYNSTVMDYNVKVRVLPNSLIANMLGYKEKPFFNATEEERKKVDIKF